MAWEVELPDVVAGQPIQSAWGNSIRDRVVHRVPTVASLPSDVPDGGIAYVEDVDRLYWRQSGAWLILGPNPACALRRGGSFNLTAGNTLPVTWDVLVGGLDFRDPPGVTGANLKAPVAGLYLVGANFGQAVTATTDRVRILIDLNGGTQAATELPPSGAGRLGLDMVTALQLVPTDVVRIMGFTVNNHALEATSTRVFMARVA